MSKKEIVKFVYDSCKEEYKDIYENWKLIDTKAQGNIAISGIFAAGLFAISGRVEPSYYLKLLFTCTWVLLLLSISASIAVLLIRKVSMPPFGSEIKDEFDEILSSGIEITEEEVDNLVIGNILELFDSNEEHHKTVSWKAEWLSASQISLIAAIFSAGVLTYFKVWS